MISFKTSSSKTPSFRALLVPRERHSGGGGHSGHSFSDFSRGRGGTETGSFGIKTSKGVLSASSSSGGGGAPAVIPNGTLFSGRLLGGGTRAQILGTSRIGSGYPYGNYGTYYGGRPFPFVFYPLYMEPGYYGGDEYAPNMNTTRPGGSLSTAIVRLPVSANRPSNLDSYYLIGDESSVSTVLSNLVDNCGIVNSIVANTYTNNTLLVNGAALVPHPEQVVQYYRASSFALALLMYNNSAALLSRVPPTNYSRPPPLSEDTPLPTDINRTLLKCLNGTIAATVPLVDIPESDAYAIHFTLIFLGTFVLLYFVAAEFRKYLYARRRASSEP